MKSMRISTHSLLGSCALVLLSAPTLPSAVWAGPADVESVRIGAGGVNSARLKGVANEFQLDGPLTVDNFFPLGACEGMAYPEKPWPANCRVSFFGPTIEKKYYAGGEGFELECDANKCTPLDNQGSPLPNRN
jgi:hypothetical protein